MSGVLTYILHTLRYLLAQIIYICRVIIIFEIVLFLNFPPLSNKVRFIYIILIINHIITHPILMPKCNFSDINMNEPMGDLRSQIMGTNTQTDGAVFKTVLFYSVLILLLPIGSFFVTKSLIFEGLLAQVS